MQIYIDESGSFDWNTPESSLFCGVTIPDRERQALFDRFSAWRASIIGGSARELKGGELSDQQLYSFAVNVVPYDHRDVSLTVVGVDTARTRKESVERLREQAGAIIERCSEIMAGFHNLRLQESYRQMSGWMRSRSPQNLLWIVALEEALIDSIQHSIVRFAEPEDDPEYVDIRIFIDESFIRKEEHVTFWREWLRNELAKSSRSALVIPDTWRPRGHPFIRAYEIHPGILKLNNLYVRHMGFFRSQNFLGLQIADICAHTVCRYHRQNGAAQAYRQLRAIAGWMGAEIHMFDINEKSLHKDDPKNHVGIVDFAEMQRKIDQKQRTQK